MVLAKAMSNKSFFSVAYKILTYLKYCYENSVDPDTDVLKESTFGIGQKQFYKTLEMLQSDGYLKGLEVVQTFGGTVYSGLDKIEITIAGLQYLEENSMMRKAYKLYKEVKDWLPIIK